MRLQRRASAAGGEKVGRDPLTDLAVLQDRGGPADAAPTAQEPDLGAPVCAVGNQFGLGLSVTCGVVSAVRRSGVGFNPIEDFIQTDAVVNPGASGGALVDGDGRLVGVLSAIFTKAERRRHRRELRRLERPGGSGLRTT